MLYFETEVCVICEGEKVKLSKEIRDDENEWMKEDLWRQLNIFLSLSLSLVRVFMNTQRKNPLKAFIKKAIAFKNLTEG